MIYFGELLIKILFLFCFSRLFLPIIKIINSIIIINNIEPLIIAINKIGENLFSTISFEINFQLAT